MRTLLILLCLVSMGMHGQRVASWNIRYDNPSDGPDGWELRKQAVADAVRACDPDILGLQEVLLHQLLYLDTQWEGYQRFGVGRDDGAERGEHSPIFFKTGRFELVDGQTFWLSPTPEFPSMGWDAACMRIATIVHLRDKKLGDTLTVVNTHFDHVGVKAREESARLVQRWLADDVRANKRVILMGDLNCTPEGTAVQQLSTTFQDACPQKESARGTFNGFDTQRRQFDRIDYIWLAPHRWKKVKYRVVQAKSADRWASDHFLVIADLAP